MLRVKESVSLIFLHYNNLYIIKYDNYIQVKYVYV